jgi:hypothetical protein
MMRTPMDGESPTVDFVRGLYVLQHPPLPPYADWDMSHAISLKAKYLILLRAWFGYRSNAGFLSNAVPYTVCFAVCPRGCNRGVKKWEEKEALKENVTLEGIASNLL